MNCKLSWDCREHVVCVGMFGGFFNCPSPWVLLGSLWGVLTCSKGLKGQLNHFINSAYAFRCSTMCLIPLKPKAVYTMEETSVCSWCQIVVRCHMKIAETLCGEERMEIHVFLPDAHGKLILQATWVEGSWGGIIWYSSSAMFCMQDPDQTTVILCIQLHTVKLDSTFHTTAKSFSSVS